MEKKREERVDKEKNIIKKNQYKRPITGKKLIEARKLAFHRFPFKSST